MEVEVEEFHQKYEKIGEFAEDDFVFNISRK